MPRSRNALIALTICLALGGLTVLAAAKKKEEPSSIVDRQRVLHVLNRFTFGPRPGDIDRVSQQGIDQWFEQQLHPEKISDEALEARLATLRTLRMDTREIVENFPPPELIKAVIDGKEPLPRDPAKRAVYDAEIARYEEKQERKNNNNDDRKNATNGEAKFDAAKSDAAPTTPASPASTGAADAGPTETPTGTMADKMADEEKAKRREAKLYADMKAEELVNMPPDQRMKEIVEMAPDEQRALLNGRSDARDRIMATFSPQQRETAMALVNPQQVVQSELTQGKLLRATYSERQLEEVMTDFWFNHFNVFVGKGADRYMITSYERDVIRPNALGKFEDLLVATAKSPAMLFYLDNWLSVGPDSDEARGIRRGSQNPGFNRRGRPRRFPPPPRPVKAKPNRDGLNENYGRELMELHTLGVNGGYTQRDVTEVARVFTGWSIHEPRKGGDFNFDERRHEPGTKIVLGKKIKEHGEKEGLEVLHLLAHHPSTAKFICTKLAQRFVSDSPPQPLVDRMAETFLKKKGDIREVLRTMYKSPEFWAPETYQAKVKTPLEFVVSALRATDADVQDATPLLGALQNMGMPLYGMQPPTGYSMKSDAWVNSSALLGRMNFALGLAGDKFKGVKAHADGVLGTTPPSDPHETLAVFEKAYLDGAVSEQTHAAIVKQLDDPQITRRKLDDSARTPNVGAIAGLILGSPEFQKR